MRAAGRYSPLLVLENVCGALTSHGGKDFTALCGALAGEGYRFGALVIDAALFVPQSRPRLSIVALHGDCAPSPELTMTEPSPLWHSRALIAAHERLPRGLREKWIWWRLAAPAARNISLADIIDEQPQGVAWRSREETQALLDKMSDVNRAKVEAAKAAGRRMVGTLYRRTRYGADGEKIHRGTQEIINLVRPLGISVEAEIGHIIKSSDASGQRAATVSVEEAKEFTAKVDVDLLAVAVGTTHGIFKEQHGIDFGLISKLHSAVKPPLVLHGTCGVSMADISRSVKAGMTKINFGEGLRMNYIRYFNEFSQTLNHEHHVWRIARAAKDRLKEDIKEIIRAVGSEGKAASIK